MNIFVVYECVVYLRNVWIAMAKAAFNKKTTLFTSTLGLNLRKNLVKWSIALYGAETGTVWAVD